MATASFSGDFTSNGTGGGTYRLSNGVSGRWELLNYSYTSDLSSLQYVERIYNESGSAYGDFDGKLYGDLTQMTGSYTGSFTVTYSNGGYTFSNYKNGNLLASGVFKPVGGSITETAGSYGISSAYSLEPIFNSVFGAGATKQYLKYAQLEDVSLSVGASSWSDIIKVSYIAEASNAGSKIEAPQVNFSADARQGSLLSGSTGNDELWGKAGWDILDGAAGNDLIRAGNGRDIITGGLGADELHGDFGWNTYKSEKDGFRDLIAIKSDQWLVNWLYGKAGNNANGEKADVIEGLDSTDQIKILGVYTSELTFQAGASSHGVTGIGIYAKGALEAVYTGGDLSVSQIAAMTTGDASAAAMNNQISSYGWTGI